MGSTEQTKTGNLIIEGVLRLGQFTTANAPAGTEGALYFDTTENKTKIYSSAAWGDLGGGEAGLLPQYTTTQRDALSPTVGQQIYNTTENTVQVYGSEDWKTVAAKLALGVTCSLDGDCDSTHCMDGVCCPTTCDGNCNRCNVAGSEGTCTDVNSDCTGNCDVCTSGNCAASVALCTTTCQQTCTGSGVSYNCYSSNSNWGAGTYGCAAGAGDDPNRCYDGACINCGGWGSGGYCWYQGSYGNNCTTVCASFGGVYNGTCAWSAGYEVPMHWHPACIASGTYEYGPLCRPGDSNRCYGHTGGSDCETGDQYRQCACNR